jgi:hypothetical protein
MPDTTVNSTNVLMESSTKPVNMAKEPPNDPAQQRRGLLEL